MFIHRHHNHHTTAQTLVSWNCKSFEGDGAALILCSRLIEEGYTKSKSGKTFFANHLLGFSRRRFFLSSGKHNRFELLRFSSVVLLKFSVLIGHSLIVSNKKLLCRFSPPSVPEHWSRIITFPHLANLGQCSRRHRFDKSPPGEHDL